MHPKSKYMLFDCVSLCKTLNAPNPDQDGKKKKDKDGEQDKDDEQGIQHPAT
jgi:hypothetical protein